MLNKNRRAPVFTCVFIPSLAGLFNGWPFLPLQTDELVLGFPVSNLVRGAKGEGRHEEVGGGFGSVDLGPVRSERAAWCSEQQ